ncbi:MAG: adenosine deaminase [Bryobacteraceae bacterium]|nr:adenosine deaminase [Bryobacteraceae bacterium]MCX7603463.1 adenosine deaminase [Bryobacteraceae bacterium]
MDLRSLPKAELHLHLEGAAAPETLCEIVPGLQPEEARQRMRFTDFQEFLQAFKWVHSCLRRPEHFALVLRRLRESLAAEGVRYAEINVSAGVILWRGLPLDEFFHAIAEEAERGPLPVRFVFDAVRQFGLDHVQATAEAAVRWRHHGVVGFGIGGDEARGPARLYREVFAYVRRHGLAAVPHGGETTGPESVWEALECGARRIGHGIRAIEDARLMDELRRRGVPLEICITSNVRTGAVRRLEEHPVRRLFDAGVPIVLSTDDPALFETTLVREYELARSAFGFAEDELRQLAENSFRYALAAPAVS